MCLTDTSNSLETLCSPLFIPALSKGQVLAALSLISALLVPWSFNWGGVTEWDQNGGDDNKRVIFHLFRHSHSSENWFQVRPWAGIQEMDQP